MDSEQRYRGTVVSAAQRQGRDGQPYQWLKIRADVEFGHNDYIGASDHISPASPSQTLFYGDRVEFDFMITGAHDNPNKPLFLARAISVLTERVTCSLMESKGDYSKLITISGDILHVYNSSLPDNIDFHTRLEADVVLRDNTLYQEKPRWQHAVNVVRVA